MPLSYFFFCFKLTHKDNCARSCPNRSGIHIPIAHVQHVESQCQLPHMECPHCRTRLTFDAGDELDVRGKLIHITYIITCSDYYGIEHFLFSSHSRVFIFT